MSWYASTPHSLLDAATGRAYGAIGLVAVEGVRELVGRGGVAVGVQPGPGYGGGVAQQVLLADGGQSAGLDTAQDVVGARVLVPVAAQEAERVERGRRGVLGDHDQPRALVQHAFGLLRGDRDENARPYDILRGVEAGGLAAATHEFAHALHRHGLTDEQRRLITEAYHDKVL
ncbi:hypothetical protein, partial [Streptomyces sp. MBT56]|uniref:hypothetical protein n=1 Tax=Streptomyces sp. MBT56 TaxID=1488387 RepID=UPI001F2EB9F7